MSGAQAGPSSNRKQQKPGDVTAGVGQPDVSLKGTFSKDLVPMMIGFGDDDCPLDETVDLVEEIVIEYASGVLKQALELSAQRGRVKAGGKALGPPTADDVLMVIRKDPRKSQRVEELLIMQKEIKMTTEQLEKDEETLAKLVDYVDGTKRQQGKAGQEDAKLHETETLDPSEQDGFCTQGKNMLSESQSPYLLQHAHQPVHWMPWSEEAFEIARRRDCPVFLSVGYSTCHWCHVMAHESFDSEEIAEMLNNNFVSIKVDKEEHVDVDSLFMKYVQATQGGGGWPMSVFLTPEKHPFYAGTYFPPHDMSGRPGFSTVLRRIVEVWDSQKEQVKHSGKESWEQLEEMLRGENLSSMEKMTGRGFDLVNDCAESLMSRLDTENGGFGSAPKFPRPCELLSMLYACQVHRDLGDVKYADEIQDAVHLTLKKMHQGGMHDHLGGGFHRYSVDELFHVPHFEIMLYDQPQIGHAYLAAFQMTGNIFYAKVAREIIGYLGRKLQHPEGAFYAAEDADSVYIDSGAEMMKEGAFYSWKSTEIDECLGNEDAVMFKQLYGVKDDGNCNRSVMSDPHREFIGMNVLYKSMDLDQFVFSSNTIALSKGQLQEKVSYMRKRLFEFREQRPKPHRDEKIVAAWNGMAISFLAMAGQILESEDPPVEETFPVSGDSPKSFIHSAELAAKFVEQNLLEKGADGTLVLYRSMVTQRSEVRGFAEDYAWMIRGLLDLYESNGKIEHVQLAMQLQESMDKLFWDEDSQQGYFQTDKTVSSLGVRIRDDYDGAEPAATSIAGHNLWRMASMLDSPVHRRRAEQCVQGVGARLAEIPLAMPQMCLTAALLEEPSTQVVISGTKKSREAMDMLVASSFQPYCPRRVSIQLCIDDETCIAFWRGHNSKIVDMVTGRSNADSPLAYVCTNYTCKAPTSDPSTLKKLLSK
eukprot:jgi/Picsp_1/3571/NSC_06408-R1_spermatogenesis-associated protein 20-like